MHIDYILTMISKNSTIANTEIIRRLSMILDEVAKISFINNNENIIGRVQYLRYRCEILGYDMREPEIKSEKYDVRRFFDNIEFNKE